MPLNYLHADATHSLHAVTTTSLITCITVQCIVCRLPGTATASWMSKTIALMAVRCRVNVPLAGTPTAPIKANVSHCAPSRLHTRCCAGDVTAPDSPSVLEYAAIGYGYVPCAYYAKIVALNPRSTASTDSRAS